MIGKTISQYEIVKKLGAGGMGVVYKANDTKLKRTVALKFLPSEYSSDIAAKERFVHEAQAASALDHPNICTIHEIGETDDGQSYIAMACYDGRSLQDKIKDERLKIEDVIEITIQIAKGLQKAHDAGIVHRDIKPANIMITEDGTAKILDFGLAKLAGQTRLTKTGSTVGTVAYMSPEQAKGEPVDQRTDIWSLGVVLYEMLTGLLPFRGDYEQAVIYSIINESPKPLNQIRADIAPELEKIINSLLLKNQDLRYLTATDVLKDLENYQKNLRSHEIKISIAHVLIQRIQRPLIGIPLVILFILLCVSFYSWNRYNNNIRWVNEQAIPQIKQLVEETKYMEAFDLATQAKVYTPDDSVLINLWPEFTWVITIQTVPQQANVYMKEYAASDSSWEYLGKSPIDSLNISRGYKQWKIEKEGFVTAETAGGPRQWSLGNEPESYIINLTLDKNENRPPGMIRIPGATIDGLKFGEFCIDKYEVTNKQYKEFVKNGGYQKKIYWKQPFAENGLTQTWEEAMTKFVDKTGRSGPASWEAGDYPDGHAEHPVNGISWYEAAAYSEFAGKELPTIYHWEIAAVKNTWGTMGAGRLRQSEIIPASNINSQDLAPVGIYHGISPLGIHDMAGNVREWCWNASPEGRFIRGGAWNDEFYMFLSRSQQSPFNRSLRNGIRCVIYSNKEKIPADAFKLIPSGKIRDYYNEKEVSNEVFQTYRDQYEYDKIDLDATIEEIDDRQEDWIKERITFRTVYDQERMIAFLFLPKNSMPPFQTVIFFPGASAYAESDRNKLHFGVVDFIVKDGRAVVYPIYFRTHMRQPVDKRSRGGQYVYKERFIKRVKDLRRTIDYLETRTCIDIKKLSFYGFSFGAIHGTIVPAVEERIKLAILYLGGVQSFEVLPEVNQRNFLSRIRIPVLMLNGRYDNIFKLETMVYPMRDLLGTPTTDKKLLVYDTDHFIPKNERIKESLEWLDKYFGPVQRK